MSTKTNAALDRRSAMRVGAVGAAATAVTVASATSAEAAAGQPILQGLSNNAGTAGTTVVSTGSAIAFTVRNNGTGAGAFFFGQNNNGFAGGTGAGSKYGLSAANTGAASSGAALAASGSKNTGILANTANSDRFAVEAVNLSASGALAGGALYAEGGDVPGVVAVSNVGVPAVVSVGDTVYVEGHEVVMTAHAAVWGATSANGPEVSFSGNATLDFNGGTTASLTGPTFYNGAQWADVDNLQFQSVTPIGQPMPNLWMLTNEQGEVTISGGVPGGSVSWRVVGLRNDWSGLTAGSATRSTRDGRLARVRQFTARALGRAERS